jgi:hypothetical protein
VTFKLKPFGKAQCLMIGKRFYTLIAIYCKSTNMWKIALCKIYNIKHIAYKIVSNMANANKTMQTLIINEMNNLFYPLVFGQLMRIFSKLIYSLNRYCVMQGQTTLYYNMIPTNFYWLNQVQNNLFITIIILNIKNTYRRVIINWSAWGLFRVF